jgi:hypothetical protein
MPTTMLQIAVLTPRSAANAVRPKLPDAAGGGVSVMDYDRRYDHDDGHRRYGGHQVSSLYNSSSSSSSSLSSSSSSSSSPPPTRSRVDRKARAVKVRCRGQTHHQPHRCYHHHHHHHYYHHHHDHHHRDDDDDSLSLTRSRVGSEARADKVRDAEGKGLLVHVHVVLVLEGVLPGHGERLHEPCHMPVVCMRNRVTWPYGHMTIVFLYGPPKVNVGFRAAYRRICGMLAKRKSFPL